MGIANPTTLEDWGFWISFFIFNFYILGTTYLLHKKKKHDFIRKRSPKYLLLQIVGGLGVLNAMLVDTYYWQGPSIPVPYAVEASFIFIQCTFLPLMLFGCLFRVINLLIIYYANKIHVEKDLVSKMGVIDRSLFKFLYFIADKSKLDVSEEAGTNERLTYVLKNYNLKNQVIFFLCGMYIVLGYILLLIARAARGCLNNSTSSCAYQRRNDMAPLYVLTFLFVIALPYFLFLVRKVRDPFYIRRELALVVGFATAFWAIHILDLFFNVTNSFNRFGCSLWLIILLIGGQTITATMPLLFLKKSKDMKISMVA